jgi:hypothetical protein
MTIGEKLKNFVNPMKWVQGFMLSKFVKKGAGVAAAAAAGLLANEKFQEALAQWGADFTFNEKVFAGALASLLSGLLASLANTAKHGPLKTVNDDPKGPPAPVTEKGDAK